MHFYVVESRRSCRALLGLEFSVHIIEELNRFRLRLGFDLFSHSFHNLIKRLWFCCATEVGDGLRGNKRKSPFMDEGGWKDEDLHCVCRLEVKRYSIYASLTSVEKVLQFTCRSSARISKEFHLWPSIKLRFITLRKRFISRFEP